MVIFCLLVACILWGVYAPVEKFREGTWKREGYSVLITTKY